MRISDWSSDVCSSDLFADRHRAAQRVEHADLHRFGAAAARRFVLLAACADHRHAGEQRADQHLPLKPLAHIVLRLNFAASASRADAATSPDKSCCAAQKRDMRHMTRSEEHTSELQSLMRHTYAVFG